MFKGISNLAAAFQQARQFGSRLQEISKELKARRVQAASGGGLVTVDINGLQEVLRIKIDPSLLGQGADQELLEDLVAAAVNQAIVKAKELNVEVLKSSTEGMNLPGLDEMLPEDLKPEGPTEA